MDRNSVDWHGPWPALVTPFDADGRIDERAFRDHVDWMIAEGVTGVVVCGCTGEPWAMTLEERKRLYQVGAEQAKGRVPVVAGISDIRTEDVVELAQAAKAARCDGVLMLPPYFVKPSADDIFAHFQAVNDAVALPIMLYNLPHHAVNVLSPEFIARLCDIPNVVAIKDSTEDFNAFYRMLRLCGDRIRVFTGQQANYGIAAVQLGAVGTVASMVNYWGRGFVEFYNACKAGDLAKAGPLQDKARALTRLILGNDRNLYAATKAAMAIRGRNGGHPRRPLRPLAEPHLSELRRGLTDLGLVAASAKAAE